MKCRDGMFKRWIALTLALLLLGQAGTIGGVSVQADDSGVQVVAEQPAESEQGGASVTEDAVQTVPSEGTVPAATEVAQVNEPESTEATVVPAEATVPEEDIAGETVVTGPTAVPATEETASTVPTEVTVPQETGVVPGENSDVIPTEETLAPVAPVSDTQVFWNPSADGKYNEEGILIVNGGNDANDGQTANAPVLSLQKALELAGSAKEIVCMNLCELSGDTTIQNATFVAYDGGKIPEAAHDGAFFSVKQGNLTLSNVNIPKTDVVVELEGGTLTLGGGMQLAGEIVLTQLSETIFPIVINQTNTTNGGKYKVNCNSDYPGVVAVAQGDHLNDFVLSDLLIYKNWELYVENGNTYAKMVNEPIIEYTAIYLNGVGGDDTNLGNAPECPVKTFQRAKDLMQQHAAEGVRIIYVMDTVTICDNELYELKSTGATNPEVQRYNYGCDALFAIADGAAPTFAFAIENTYSHTNNNANIDVAVQEGGTLILEDGFHTYEYPSDKGDIFYNIRVSANSSLIVQGQDVQVDRIGALGTVTMTAGAVNMIRTMGQAEVTVSGGTVKRIPLESNESKVTVTENAVIEQSKINQGSLYSEGGHIKYVTLEKENCNLYINGVGTIDGIMLQNYKPSIYLSGRPKQADPILLELGEDMRNDQVAVYHYNTCDASKHLDKFTLLESEKRYYLSIREKDIILKPCGVFVDTDKGDDQNSGLRDDQPVKTFAKAAELMNYHALQPGSELPHNIYILNTGTTGAQIYGDDTLIIDPALTDVLVIPYVGDNCEAMLRITDGNSFAVKNVQFDRADYFEKYINNLLDIEGGTTNLTACRMQCSRNGLHVVGGVVNLDNCVFNGRRSEADYGRLERNAVKTSGGKVNIQNTAIRDMSFSEDGGGIRAEAGSSVSMINCLIENNSCSQYKETKGACVYAGAGSKVYMQDVTIQKNYGSGIYWDCAAELTVDGTITVSENNTATGGGIFIGSSSSDHTPHTHVLDEHFKINNNKARNKGGGVYVTCSDTVVLQNCDLSGNQCDDDTSGTAVYAEQGTVEHHNATLTGGSEPIEYGNIFIAENAVLKHLEGTIDGSVYAQGLYQLNLSGKDVGVRDKIYLENAFFPLTLIGSYTKLDTPLVVAPTTGFIGQIVIDGNENCTADLQNFQVEGISVEEKNFDVVAEKSKFVFWDPQNQGGKSSDANDGSCPAKAVHTWGRVRQILAQKEPGTTVVMCSAVDGRVWEYLGVDENGVPLSAFDGQIGEGDSAWNTQIVRGTPAKGQLLTEKMFDQDTMNLELKNITLNGQFYAGGDAITSGRESFGMVNADRISLTNVTVCDYVAVTRHYDCEAIVAKWLNDQNVTYTRNVGHLVRVQREWHADEDRVIGNSISQDEGALFYCNKGSVVRNCVFSGNNLGFDTGNALVQSLRGLTMENCQIGAEKPGKIPQSPEECLTMGGNVVGEPGRAFGSPYGLIDGCTIARNVTIYGNWLESPAFYTGRMNCMCELVQDMRVEGNYGDVNAIDLVARYGSVADVENVQCVNNSVACALYVENANMKNCVISGNKRCNNGRDIDGVGLRIYNEGYNQKCRLENCKVLENEGNGVLMDVRYATYSIKNLECQKNGRNGLVAYGSIAFSGVNDISENTENGIMKDYSLHLTKDETDPSAKLLVHHNGKHGIGCEKHGDAELSGLSIYENAGAGVFLRDQEKLIMRDSDIYSNHGGGVECDNYKQTIQADLYNTKIRDNQGKSGAGLYAGRKCTANLYDVTITGNTAEEYGGGIAMEYGSSFDTTVHVHSGVIRDNESKGDGNKSSGIYSDAHLKMGGGKVDIDDTIYLANRAIPITLTNSMSAGDNYTISLNQEGEKGFKLGDVVVQPNPDAFPSNVAQYVRFTSAYDESLVFAKGSATPGGKVDSIVLKRCIFVDGVGGSDTNLGKNPNDAYKTMEKALEEAANGNAVIFVSGPVTGSGNWDCTNPVEIKRYTGFAVGGLHAYPPYVGEMIHVPARETLTVGANILGIYGRHTEDDPVMAEGSIFHVDGTLRLEHELNMGGNGSQKMTGGAIYVSESGNVQITAPVAISGTKAQDGGAIYNKGTVTVGEGGSLVLDRTSAFGKGSAVYQCGTFTVQAGSSLTTDGVIYLDTDCCLTLGDETVVFPKGIRLDIASPSDGRIYAKYLNKTKVDPDAEQNRYELMGHLTSIYLLEHREETNAVNLILSTSNVVYLDPLYTGGPQEGIGKQGCKADYPVTTLQDAYRYLQERGGLIYIVTPVHIDKDVTLGLNQCIVGAETVTLGAGSVYIRRYSKPEGDIFGFQKAPNDQALFEVEKNSSLTLDGVTLDGHATAVTGASEKYSFTNALAVDAQYPLVMVEDGTALTLRNGAGLKNNHNITAEKAHEGDAVNNDQAFAIEQQAAVEGTVKLGTEDFVTIHGGKTSPVPSMHVLLDDPRDGRVIAQYDEAPASEEKDKYILAQSILDVYKVVIEGNQVLLRDKGAAYVDGVAGDDTRDGTTPENAVKTLKQAYANLQKDGGGTIYIVNTVTVDQYMMLLGNQYIDLKDNIEVPGNVRILRYSQPDAAASLTGFQVPSFTGAMLNVTGDLTLKNINMDGHGNAAKTDSEKTTAGAVQAVQPMLTVAGQLTLDKGAVLRSNHNTAGNGGAVSVDSTGKLTVFDAELTDNQAVHGSGVALYDSTMTTTAHPGFANDQYVYLDGAQDTEGSWIHVTNQLDAQVVIPVELPDYYVADGHKIAEYDDYAPDGIVPDKAHFALRDDSNLLQQRMLGVLTEEQFVLLRAEYDVKYILTDLDKSVESPVRIRHQTGFTAVLAAEAPFRLPSTITVQVQPVGQTENVELTPGEDYTYDSASGMIEVFAKSVTGHVTIIAAGERSFDVTYDVTLTAKESRDDTPNDTVTLDLVDAAKDMNLDKLLGKTFTLEKCELPADVKLESVDQVKNNRYRAGYEYANGTFSIAVSTPSNSNGMSLDQNNGQIVFAPDATEAKLVFDLHNANAITNGSPLYPIQMVLRSNEGDRVTVNLTIKRIPSQINVSVPLVMVMRTGIDGGTVEVDKAVYNVKNLSSMDVKLENAEITDSVVNNNIMTYCPNVTTWNDEINCFTVHMNQIPMEIAYEKGYNPISSISCSRLNFVTKDGTPDGKQYGVHMANVNYTVAIPKE